MLKIDSVCNVRIAPNPKPENAGLPHTFFLFRNEGGNLTFEARPAREVPLSSRRWDLPLFPVWVEATLAERIGVTPDFDFFVHEVPTVPPPVS